MIANAPQTMCGAFQATAARHPDAVALRTPGDGVVITWRQYAEQVRRIAGGLAALGVRRGEAVGLMLTNRPEFHLVDMAALHLGAVPFSVYNTLAAEQLRYVLTNAGNRVMVCEKQFLPVVRSAVAGTAVEHVVCVDCPASVGDPASADDPSSAAEPASADGSALVDGVELTRGLAELEAREDPDFDFEAAWRAVQPSDLITIVYTSGTTGPPKGVELTHANLLAQDAAAREIMEFDHTDRGISYLPDAHIANRLIAHYLAASTGSEVTTVADIKAAVAALPEVRSTFFLAVPQVWYKLKAAIEAALAAESSPVKRWLAAWAISVGRRVARARSDGAGVSAALRLQLALAERLVLAPIRAKLGLGQVRLAVSGAAPISPDVLEFVLSLGIPCSEVWGLSETAGSATMNRPGAIRIGTVGQAIKDVAVKVADDGELLVAGPIVMRGYRGDPARTAEAIDADGWLHTGDIGTIDGDGYVRVVDRKKELIINAAGKNMSPSNIEGAVRAASPLIGGVVAIGDDRPYVTALVTLDPDAAEAFAARKGIEDGSAAVLASNALVREEIDRAVATANANLSRVEQIKRFTLLPVAWEPAGDELTPTMKLRRRPIGEKYAREIAALYADQ